MTDSLLTLEIDGCAVPLRVRRNARARNLILRLDEQTGGAVVTIPKRTSVREAYDMALRKSDWIAVQLKRRPAKVPFAPGAVIPILGIDHEVQHNPVGRGITCVNGAILVSGREEHLARRLADWLKAQAKAEITPRAHAKAEGLQNQANRRVGRITVRDTRSRWGSCAADGQLNFSWRLILAPEHVLDYVVAHEVAHLVHRNHGEAFWALTNGLTERMGEARAWLNAHGRSLHRFG